MGKVYGYCRVALKNDEEIAAQCKIIDDYCRDNGLKVGGYFCDNGVSGLKFDRDALNRMLQILQEGDIVIVKDIARLSREYRQCISIAESICRAGALLKIIN